MRGPCLTVALLAACAPALASPLTASTILSDFNAVIYTNATTQSDIEGGAIIGGNFAGATVYSHPNTVAPLNDALVVFGAVGGNGLNLNNGGNAFVGGAASRINYNGGGHQEATSPVSAITDLSTPLNALSSALSRLTPTTILPATNNNEVLTATPGANGIAVLDITAAQLATIPSFTINFSSATSFIVNVSGSAASFNANDEYGSLNADKILWNFYNASTVAINTLIGGTVLAPLASVTNSNQIDGVLVANAWTGQGELHDEQFDGTLPADPVAAVPEPAAVALLLAPLLALAYVRTKPCRRIVSAVGSSR